MYTQEETEKDHRWEFCDIIVCRNCKRKELNPLESVNQWTEINFIVYGNPAATNLIRLQQQHESYVAADKAKGF